MNGCRICLRVLLISCAFLVGMFGPISSHDAQAKPPNILLILADDVGRETIGCYGGEFYATPNVDRLARGGLKFNHSYVSPVCHPTRTTLITGKYLTTIGSPKWGSFPTGPLEQQTVAHQLKQAGYATAAAGKWHLATLQDDPQHPHRLGFDEYCFFGWHEGPRYWQPRLWQNGALRDDVADRFGPDVYTEFLIDFMQRNKSGPFFAYFPMTLCHAVSDDYLPRPAHGPRDRYMTFAEMLAEMDLRVGQLIDAVKELGIAEETLIIFTTDNGTSTKNFIRHEGEKLIVEEAPVTRCNGKMIRGAKGLYTDWGIGVPTVAYWPGTIEPGKTTDEFVDVSDYLPTLNELAGSPAPEFDVDGRSFAGLLTGGRYEPRDWICSQKAGSSCIRARDWKLLSNGQLFDMRNDPDEKQPIVAADDTDESTAARGRLQTILNSIVDR